MAIMAAAQLEEEPAARNSKRFPVKAKGEVRLRSVVSSSISGNTSDSQFQRCLFFRCHFLLSLSGVLFRRGLPRVVNRGSRREWREELRWLPDGELLLALMMEARSRFWFLYTIISTFTRKVRNSIFPFGFLPGANKLMPVSVQSDQLLCLPEPFTPL